MATNAEFIWQYFITRIRNAYGVAGLLGNLEAESALMPNRVQGTTVDSTFSAEYTAAVDSGEIGESEFVNNGPNGGGYGLAQWTYPPRKQALYDLYKSGGYSSIGSLDLACAYLWVELQSVYSSVLAVLKSAKSVREASDAVLHDFESPADQSTAIEVYRAGLCSAHYAALSGSITNNKDLAIIDTAVNWAMSIANDDTHGYSQEHRHGPDYDCASLLITAWENAGVMVGDAGASYTKNMYGAFLKCGFNDVTATVNFVTGEGFLRGDILLNPLQHVEMMVSPTERVGAHWDYDGVTGDSSGNEINIKPYANLAEYGWTYCLRYGAGYAPIPSQKRRGMSKLLLYAVGSDIV